MAPSKLALSYRTRTRVTAATVGAAVIIGLGTASCSRDSPKEPVSAAASSGHSAASGSGDATDPPGSKTAVPSSKAPAGQSGSCTANKALSHMSEEQRVGQLFMVSNPATSVDSRVASAISTYHLGNVFLSGRSSSGTGATASVTSALRSHASGPATDQVGLIVSTDQEGGQVQALRGPGFTDIPSATTMGSRPASQIQSDATTYGSQLKSAGVDMDLAPVADTVPDGVTSNPPIGDLNREFGRTPETSATGAAHFAAGLRAAGVIPTAKHFPGLGQVKANTDMAANVHDTSTSAASAVLTPFFTTTKAAGGFVMLSSAIYDKIDSSAPAVFSPKVIQLLRSRGFTGPTITDDVGHAAAMTIYSPADRALKAINAGISIVLTGDVTNLPQMYNTVLSKAKSDKHWHDLVWAAASKVLIEKQQVGLLPKSC